MADIPPPPNELLRAGIELPADKKFYFNGIAVATTPADVVIILLQNGQPIVTLNSSHGVAKTLAENLGTAIENIEKQIGQEIFSAEKMASFISKEEKGG